jgi:hypothetical protein
MAGKIVGRFFIITMFCMVYNIAFSANFNIQQTDTIFMHDQVMGEDTCIGPEMMAKENAYIPKDGELLQFSDLLSQFLVTVKGKIISN